MSTTLPFVQAVAAKNITSPKNIFDPPMIHMGIFFHPLYKNLGAHV